MFSNNKHEINDNFGTNQIYFPKGVSPEDIKVSLAGGNDVRVQINNYNGGNEYFIIKNFGYRTEDKIFKLLFTFSQDGQEQTMIMNADYKSSPFRTLYGTSGNDMLKPIFHDTISNTIYGGDGMIK